MFDQLASNLIKIKYNQIRIQINHKIITLSKIVKWGKGVPTIQFHLHKILKVQTKIWGQKANQWLSLRVMFAKGLKDIWGDDGNSCDFYRDNGTTTVCIHAKANQNCIF